MNSPIKPLCECIVQTSLQFHTDNELISVKTNSDMKFSENEPV